MQEERSTLDSFPETVDLNQGSIHLNTSMEYSNSRDNTDNPVENIYSNYALSSSVENITTNTANSRAPIFSGWDRGESSSGTNNKQVCNDDSKMKLGWPSSFIDFSARNAKSDDISFEQSNFAENQVLSTFPSLQNHDISFEQSDFAENQVLSTFPSLQNHHSNHGSLNINSNNGIARESNRHENLGAGPPHAQYVVGTPEIKQIHTSYGSSSNTGSSLGWPSTMEINYASGPLFGTVGSSCKRKAIDGTSGQFYPGESSISDQRAENIMQHPIPRSYTSPINLSVSTGPLNLSPANSTGQLNSRIEIGTRRVTPAFFPSPSIPRIAQSSTANLPVRSNNEHQRTGPLETPRGSCFGPSSVHNAQHLSQPVLNNYSSVSRSPLNLPMIPINIPNQSQPVHLNEARHMLSRGDSSSSSFMNSVVRGSGAGEVLNVRSSFRNNPECPMIVPAPETRNVLQDQIDWSFTPGTLPSSRNQPIGSLTGPSSGRQTYSRVQLPRRNETQNHQRFLEDAPWVTFPSIEPNSASRRNHFSYLTASPSSSDEAGTTSGAVQQSEPAFLMNMSGDDSRALAYLEGRQRLIRQVLNAMRRGVQLHAEDYMLINGYTELPDRHRDMRLDVDNMSYEELLALEERIGNVSTGLNEEKILGSMKRRVFETIGPALHLEPCCICQEDYIAGDDVGILDCGHEFHTGCIKQWLVLKNLCPICKKTALGN